MRENFNKTMQGKRKLCVLILIWKRKNPFTFEFDSVQKGHGINNFHCWLGLEGSFAYLYELIKKIPVIYFLYWFYKNKSRMIANETTTQEIKAHILKVKISRFFLIFRFRFLIWTIYIPQITYMPELVIVKLIKNSKTLYLKVLYTNSLCLLYVYAYLTICSHMTIPWTKKQEFKQWSQVYFKLTCINIFTITSIRVKIVMC